MREILDVTVGTLMSQPAVTVGPETSIEALTELMATHGYNAFPVVDGAGVLQGLVTRLDLFKLYLLPYRRFIAALEDTWIASVAGIMGRGAVALTPTDSAIKAIALMVEYRLRTIPIVTPTATGAVVVGVVTRRDLVAALKP